MYPTALLKQVLSNGQLIKVFFVEIDDAAIVTTRQNKNPSLPIKIHAKSYRFHFFVVFFLPRGLKWDLSNEVKTWYESALGSTIFYTGPQTLRVFDQLAAMAWEFVHDNKAKNIVACLKRMFNFCESIA